MHTKGSVEIDRPIDEVFRLTTEDVAQWSNIVVEDEMIESTPQVVGSKFRTVSEEHGRRMVFAGMITEHREPTLHRVELIGDQFDIDALYTFDDLGGRTRVTQSSNVAGKGFFRWVLMVLKPFVGKANCRALQKELDSLKHYCESKGQPAMGKT